MSNYSLGSSNIKFVPSVKDPYDGGGPGGSAFTAKINPESIKHSRAVNVNSENVANTAFDTFQFKGYGKETVSMQLIIDGTGYVNATAGSVTDQLQELLECVYQFQSGSHKCHFIQINYGKAFKKKWWNIESFDVNYTLFDSKGDPLIAEVDLSFVIHRNKKALSQADPPFSPDVTHIFTFKEGDSLTSMCQEIYDDVGYYVQIAKMNGLTNFREIPIGTKLFFPPLINLS
jgi:nucleoid-associated protein YgaU